MGRARLRPAGSEEPRIQEITPATMPPAPATAPCDPLKKTAQPVLPLICSNVGAPNGKPKEGFAWEETKGIE
jgi:hypothetical protein